MAEKMTLMPCPFCGAPAAKNRNPGDRWVYYCPNGHTGYLRHKEWQARSHLAQPAQAVDCCACEGRPASGNSPCHVCGKSAQAEGWNINKRGDVWDVTYTPPTKAAPNAHER